MKVTTLQYAKTLLELTENKSQEDVLAVVKSFAQKLKTQGQLKNTGKILNKFEELHDAKHGIVQVSVISTRSLADDQIHQIANFVKEKYSAKQVVVKNIIDESIKGGIIIKVGDEILDGSISKQLQLLKNKLIN